MKTLFIHLKTQKFFCSKSLIKSPAFTSMVFLFFSATPAFTAPSCRPYFIQNDVLQKFDSEEYASLLTSAEMLGRLLGKTDSVSQNAKEALDKQVWGLIASKRLTAEQKKLFLAFFLEQVQEHQPTDFLRQQEAVKSSLLKEQQAYFRQMKLIMSKYQTDDINIAFYYSCYKNKFNNHTVNIQEMQMLLSMGADINHKYTEMSASGDTMLMSAADSQNWELFEFLINAKADLEVRDNNGSTALSRASASGYHSAAQFLIQNGAKVDTKNQQGMTPLMLAVKADDFSIIYNLLKIEGHIDLQNNEGMTALMIAVKNRDTRIAQRLIEVGANLDIPDNAGVTALQHAIHFGNGPQVELLLQAGAQANTKTLAGFTTLMSASATHKKFPSSSKDRNDGVVEKLLTLKAPLDAIDDKGRTALMQAILEQDPRVPQLLIDAKADLNIQDKDGYSALIIATIQNDTDVIKHLVQAGANVNLRDHRGRSALITAIKNNTNLTNSYLDIIKLLINAKADLDIYDHAGHVPLILAVESKQKEIVQLLVEAGANVNFSTNTIFNSTALIRAAADTNQEAKPDLSILKILMAAKANPYLTDKHGLTAQRVATKTEVIQLLTEYEKSLSWSMSLLFKLRSFTDYKKRQQQPIIVP